MTLMKKMEMNASELNKVLKDINSSAKKEASAIDKEWLDFLKKQGKLKTNGKAYTPKEAYKEAKEQRERILDVYQECDTKKQLELVETITYLNNVIEGYESEFAKKEEAKKQAINCNHASEKANAVKESIEDSIAKIDEEIEQLKIEFEEVNKKLVFSLADNNKSILEELTKIEEEKIALLELKKCFGELITLKNGYNSLVDLTKKLPKKYYPVIEFYYNTIKSNLINMKDISLNVNADDNDNKKNLDEIKSKINELLNRVKTEKNLSYLDEALKLIEELEECEKLEFLKQIEEIKKSFQKNDNEFYKKAMELLAHAEETNSYVDFSRATKYLFENKSKLDEFEEELGIRLKKISDFNIEAFKTLLVSLEEKVANHQLLEESEVTQLKDKYQFLIKDEISEYNKRVDNVIAVYNIETQEIAKTNYNHEEDKKYGFFARVSEFLGKGITLLSGTKVAYNISKKRLEKAIEKFDNAEDDEKEYYKEKVENIKNTLVQQDTASGVRLYSARNYIRKMKPKLYNDEELTNYQNMRLEHSQKNIIKQVSKKLNKVTKLEGINESKVRVINVLDQYIEMLATCYYGYNKVSLFQEEMQKAYNFLEKSSDVLTNEEYFGYFNQLNIIYNYRTATDGSIYELNMREDENDVSYEIDSIIKNSYLDANVYRNACSHVLKRK